MRLDLIKRLEDPNFILGSLLIGAGIGEIISGAVYNQYEYLAAGALTLGIGLLTKIPEKRYQQQ